ncbi:MAG: STN domain-containing protein [Pseudomonadota bacterium]
MLNRALIAMSRRVLTRLGVATGIMLSTLGAQGAYAGDRTGAADPASVIMFNLPAQPLEAALERYSIVSGWQVIYKTSLAIGRRSVDVRGKFTPRAALRMLLAGTGLVPQFKAADSVILISAPPNDTATADESADEVDPSLEDYYALVQSVLKRTFCATPQIRAGSYRIALGFWIGASGMVTRTALLGSTGRNDIDESFDRAVRSISVGTAPPVGFRQPIVLLVTPDLFDKCGALPIGGTNE